MVKEVLLSIEEFAAICDTVKECEPNAEHIDFGPAYGMAVQRRERTLALLHRAYDRAKKAATTTQGE